MPKTVTWRMPTADEASRLGLDDAAHKNLAAAAAARIDDRDHPLTGDVAKVAAAVQMSVADLRSRAKDHEPRRPTR